MFEKYPLIVSRYEELSEAIVQPDIIADTARYQAYLKERAALEEQVTAWQSYQSLLRHREQAQEMLSDPDLHEMAAEELQSLAAQIAEAEQQLRILLLPRDPDDDHSIIMEIRGGAGGEESCLFAAELMRMYIRYAERHHFRVEPISTTETELGGIKEAVFSIAGSGVFARMKYESGVHRVQRVPPPPGAAAVPSPAGAGTRRPGAEARPAAARSPSRRWRSPGPAMRGRPGSRRAPAARCPRWPPARHAPRRCRIPAPRTGARSPPR